MVRPRDWKKAPMVSPVCYGAKPKKSSSVSRCL
jgi:hypothetical protein